MTTIANHLKIPPGIAEAWLELLSDKVGGGEDDGGFNIEIPRFEQSVPSAQSLKHGKEVVLSRL